MAEKIKKNKKDSEVKEELIDLNIPSFKCDGTNDDESFLITKFFNPELKGVNIFKNKQVPYFYHENQDIPVIANNLNNQKIFDYYLDIKQKLRYAYNTFEILQNYEDFIDVLDRPENDNKKQLLPRYKKMKRLEAMYEILIRFTMTLIHNFFWRDITEGLSKGTRNKNL